MVLDVGFGPGILANYGNVKLEGQEWAAVPDHTNPWQYCPLF